MIFGKEMKHQVVGAQLSFPFFLRAIAATAIKMLEI